MLATRAAAQPAPSERERAVLEARAGDLGGAIAALRRLLRKEPRDPLVAMDLAVLLQQAGQARAATDVFERARVRAPPEYALLAVTRAYRDQRRFDAAAALAEEGARRFPGTPGWPVLRALILADTGRGDRALGLLAGPAAKRAQPVEWWLAEAYAFRRSGEPTQALRGYMQALRLAPDSREARAAAASLLRDLGGAYGAAALNDAPPPLTAGRERRPLAADQAAAEVRWGDSLRPADPARRFAQTDAAIASLDGLIAETAADPRADPQLLRRLRLDRMVALRDRQRMREVVDEAARLDGAGPLPPYAREALADALLYLRRPKEAQAHYRAVIAADPGDTDARYGLFYAQVEAEDFAGAYRTIDRLVREQPAWRSFKDDPGRHPDPDYTGALLTAGLARLYGDQRGEALGRIAPLAAAAPANAAVRSADAAVMAARGWPRQAETEARIARSLDPLDAGIERQLAGLDIQRYRFASAADRVRRLQALYPDDLGVRRLADDLGVARSALLELDVSPGWSEGGGSNATGNDLSLHARLWSPAIGDRWRVFAVEDYAHAHPPEGFVERDRTGVGLELRLPDVTATAYATYSTGEVDEPGGGASLEWRLDDHVRLALKGEIFSIDTPLRALVDGVTADEVGGSATYRWSESRELSLSAAYLGFSDGNDRLNGGVDLSQSLVDVPHFGLTGRASVWASSNSRDDVIYYNPSEDLAATAGLRAEHVVWRSYERSLVQRLTGDVGTYTEAGHGTDWIATFGYEHEWQLGPRTDFRYGVTLASRVYDGDRENGLALTFGLSQRF